MNNNENLNPKDSRRKRLKPRPGVIKPISLDLGRIIQIYLKESKGIDPSIGINRIPVLIIPVLFSFIRTLAVEIENQKEGHGKGTYKSKLLATLDINMSDEINKICGFYKINKELKKSANVLYQIRHEIIHPSPYIENYYPLPKYLQSISLNGILWEPPEPNFACNVLDFFSSHKLLKWGTLVILDIAQEILDSDIKHKHLNEIYYILLNELRLEG